MEAPTLNNEQRDTLLSSFSIDWRHNHVASNSPLTLQQLDMYTWWLELYPTGVESFPGYHGGMGASLVHVSMHRCHGTLPQLCVIVNPRRACAARVTVLSVSQSVSVSVHDYSRTAGNEAASERYQQLQRNKRSKIKKAILLKRRRSRSRNWHYRGSRCA